jgi:hypothetical protein
MESRHHLTSVVSRATSKALASSCPGPEPVYLGRDFESPELVFVRALDMDD